MEALENMKVYVGTYAKYNEGSLAGAWLTLGDYDSVEEFFDACRELHKDEDDPEYMFQDWEEIPEGYIGESWITGNLWDVFGQLDEREIEPFKAYCAAFLSGEPGSSDIRRFRERYCGRWESEEAYADSIVDDCFDIPDNIRPYFDYEKFTRDLFYDYYFADDPNGGGFVFSC